jgi:dihydrofolate reductase
MIMGRRSYDNSIVNVLLGGGRRLFDQLPRRVELKQTGVTETEGVAHLEYRVVR